jgi:signal transduction histidine kinase/ligand-binding sensor domain-containing protein/DNA-binding response OmpR family regulator
MRTKQFIFIFLSCTLFSSTVQAQTDRLFTSDDKLPNSHVNSVYQDSKGYIWICTENGLCVFNGSDFKTYYHIPGDSTSLENNHVIQVLEDSHGNFWVGTILGLQRYHRKTDNFSSFKLSYAYIKEFRFIKCIFEDKKGNIWLSTSGPGVVRLKAKTLSPTFYMRTNSNICSDNINTMFEDRFGNIWIGSQDNGLSLMNIDNHSIINYFHDPDDEHSLSSNQISAIYETPDGTLLIGTLEGGIDSFDYYTKSFKRKYISSVNMVFTMITDSKNNLWIGTDGQGIKCYNPATKSLVTYETNLLNLDFSKLKAHSFHEDKQGNIWVALFQKGVLMIPPQKKSFENIGFNPFIPNKNIGTECVLSIIEDHRSQLWVGTDGDGLYRLNVRREVIDHYQKDRLPGNCVLAVFEDSKKRIWAGTYLHGLYLYNPAANRFEKVPLKVNGQDVKDINCIAEDKEGKLWIGTNEKGLCIYHPETKEIKSYLYDPLKSGDQLLSNYIHTICFSSDGLVWLGSGGAGIACFDPEKNTFTDYTKQNGWLNGNDIYAIVEDHYRNIWIGTKNGLNCIDKASGNCIFYHEKEGLPNAVVCAIEIDKDNNLWISTCEGLSFFDTSEEKFVNYHIQDGIINEEFRRSASFQSRSGEIFFGGINGISSFMPFAPQSVHPLFNLEFTDLYLLNERIVPENKKNAILKKSIDTTSEIQLSYSVKSFSIGFAGIEYNTPEKVIYKVKIDGFDDDWKTVPFKNKGVTYTNLSPGKYILRVKAYLPETEPIEKILKIIISPPFWLTWWAKVIYSLLTIACIYFAYRLISRHIRKKDDELNKLKEEQMVQSQLQFFTDISHEIRTPLTLVLTPLQQLIKETGDPKLLKIYTLMFQNGERILRLVNQLMEMRRLDRGQVRLRAEKTDVAPFFQEIMSSFEQVARDKKIRFSLEMSNNLPEVWIDQEKIDKVIFNVLSNAFKYTPDNGEIKISIDTTDSDLRIRVADTGPGIPEAAMDLIFNRFYQIQDTNNKSRMGTGIGLHLSRSLMEIHHGKIFVESEYGNGSVFIVLIPLDHSYLKPDEQISEHRERSLATLVQPSLLSEPRFEPETSNRRRSAKYKILVVEDDTLIREYIAGILSVDYEVIQSEDGKQGLEMALSELPDCIISDVMMPGMDGIALCKKIKTNESTCHIPVILLTAKTNIEQRVEGLQTGADSYIPKPFNIEHLQVRVQKLIELRKTLKQKYEGKLDIPEDSIKMKSADEIFLQKVDRVIQEQLSNSELSVEVLGQHIGMSRSQLQRKLKQLVNQNPSDYIKIMRLRHAAHLLSAKKFAVSEIAYATGFSSQAHFSNSFKEIYGMSPTRYMEII